MDQESYAYVGMAVMFLLTQGVGMFTLYRSISNGNRAKVDQVREQAMSEEKHRSGVQAQIEDRVTWEDMDRHIKSLKADLGGKIENSIEMSRKFAKEVREDITLLKVKLAEQGAVKKE